MKKEVSSRREYKAIVELYFLLKFCSKILVKITKNKQTKNMYYTTKGHLNDITKNSRRNSNVIIHSVYRFLFLTCIELRLVVPFLITNKRIYLNSNLKYIC